MQLNKFVLLIFLMIVTISCGQEIDADYFKSHYDLKEYRIPMRDGAELFTVVYTPKDQTKKYPRPHGTHTTRYSFTRVGMHLC